MDRDFEKHEFKRSEWPSGWFRGLGIAGAILLGLALVVLWVEVREPSFNGRPLSHWLAELNTCGALDRTGPAAEAIRGIGAPGLPLILRRLQPREGSGARRIARELGGMLLPSRFGPRDPSLYEGPALFALQQLGPQAGAIVPELVQMLQSTNRSTSILGQSALLSAGVAFRSYVEAACEHSNADVRARAAWVLAKYEERENRPLQWLWVRERLVVSVEITPENVVSLATNLKHPSGAVRRATADWFQFWSRMFPTLRGEVSKQHLERIAAAVPELRRAMDDVDASVRASAQRALAVLDQERDTK